MIGSLDFKNTNLLVVSIAVVVFVVLFFVGYNAFLVDRSLSDLRYSLDTLSKCDSMGEARVIIPLVRRFVTNDLSDSKMPVADVAAMDMSLTLLEFANASRSAEDIRYAIKQVDFEKSLKRNSFLIAMDKLSNFFAGGLSGIFGFPHIIVNKFSVRDDKIDDEALQRADGYFVELKFEQARDIYESLIKKYAQYRGLGRVKLRLAECLQRLGQYSLAEKTCNSIIWSDYGAIETGMAKRMLAEFKDQAQLRLQRAGLKKKLLSASPLLAGGIYFQLGVIDMSLSAYEAAVEDFRNCIKNNPDKELLAKAQFNIAWCFRQNREYDQSLAVSKELMEQNRGKDIAVAAGAQMAGIFYSQGKLKEAAALYAQLADENPQSSLAPLLLYSSGAIYYHDLNDMKSANKIFSRLKSEYPVSAFSYSSFGLRSIESEGREISGGVERDLILKKMYNPVAAWIESSFSAVTRIVKTTIYKMAQKLLSEKNEATFTRDYTEEEFYKFALEPFLLQRKGQVYDASMKIRNKKIYGQAVIKLGIVKLDISGSSDLASVDNQFVFRLDSLKVGFISLPKVVLDGISYEINRSLAIDNFPLQVKNVVVKEGMIAITYRVIKSDRDILDAEKN